ncbi:hypothetical protein NHP200010_11920 [Helicobacter bizzozeronii]|uniref:hypothetical protein n=1 Tax=Helicobacter bizzozeronii TaxID=56877 RepID=UPI00244D8C5F|nr:hypothetical protein [Helicobacter bizzozeronii]GMB93472.1 hypothetical protein NHP200010_11920 [Helicobacter bizzozeronii]
MGIVYEVQMKNLAFLSFLTLSCAYACDSLCNKPSTPSWIEKKRAQMDAALKKSDCRSSCFSDESVAAFTWMKDFFAKNNLVGSAFTNYVFFGDDYQQAFKIGDRSYTFFYSRGESRQKDGEQKDSLCLGISFQKQVFKGFCLEGFNQLELSSADGANSVGFTLSKKTPPTPTTPAHKTSIYLAFQLLEGTFYLSHFSNPQQVFYNQPNSKQIPLFAIDNALLAKLQAQPQEPLEAQTLEINTQTYSISNQISANTNCVTITEGKTLRTQRAHFCMEGVGEVRAIYNEGYLTLEFAKTLSDTIKRQFYLTFKLRGYNDFYLHQYSAQNLKINADGSTQVLSSQIIYSQDRDDPRKQNPISLDSWQDGYQAKLLAQCQKHGYCM